MRKKGRDKEGRTVGQKKEMLVKRLLSFILLPPRAGGVVSPVNLWNQYSQD